LEELVMLEKILLSITITFSLYLSAQSDELNKTPMFSVVEKPVISAPTMSEWR
jgi:hypothetical protein